MAIIALPRVYCLQYRHVPKTVFCVPYLPVQTKAGYDAYSVLELDEKSGAVVSSRKLEELSANGKKIIGLQATVVGRLPYIRYTNALYEVETHTTGR